MDTFENDKLVSDFLAKEKEEIAALKTIRNEELLDSLGLFTTEKKYAPDDYYPAAGWASSQRYPRREETDGRIRYYRQDKKIYPAIDDDTYNELVKTLREDLFLVGRRFLPC